MEQGEDEGEDAVDNRALCPALLLSLSSARAAERADTWRKGAGKSST